MTLWKTEKALWAAEFIDLPEAAAASDARWEPFQIGYLNNPSRFAIDVKARQIAWSFTAAVDAVTDGVLNPDTAHIFTSINLSEAKEKIRYTAAIVRAIDWRVRPDIIRQSSTEIEFLNGSRFISHPCRPPRGKPRARIYLDEMAHYKDGLDREIYTAALPATTKGDGYVRIGSSPLGAKGLFWEIATESMRAWPGYVRRFIPWWNVRALCVDVKMARMVEPRMSTSERVHTFGTRALREIFENMFLEDFQQEYECAWVDEATAWITWETIKKNQDADLIWYHATTVDEALALIPVIIDDIQTGRLESSFLAGLDIGRKRDLTEFMMLGNTTTGRFPLRFSVSLDRVEYDDQERCFVELLNRLPIANCLIDESGIGAQLAENIANKTGKAEGVTFTNANKELWAVEARIQAQRGRTPLPVDRDIAYQIHSIKKTTTAAKNNVFDTERNEKHHADKFWAWALGVWAGSGSGATWGDLENLGTVSGYESRWA